MRLQKAEIIFKHALIKKTGAYSSLVAKKFFKKTNIFISQNLFAGFIKHVKLVVIGDKIWLHLPCIFLNLFSIITIDNCFVTNATHQRNKDFQVTVFATDLLFKSRLQERIETFHSNFWLTLTIQESKQIKLVDSESQLWIFLRAFFFSVMVLFVLDIDKNVIPHQDTPI